MFNNFKYQKTTLLAMLGALFCVGLAGCKQTPVTPVSSSTSEVSFVVNWSEIEKSGYEKPKSAKMWIYPPSGLPTICDVTQGQLIKLNLEQGYYKVIVSNDDLNYLKRRAEESFDNHDIYLEVKPNSSATPGWDLPALSSQTKVSNYSMVDNADKLFTLTGSSPRVVEVQGGINSDVELKPRSASSVYNVMVNFTSDDQIAGGAAIVTGVATAMSLSNAKLKSTTNVGMEFSLSKTGDNQLIGAARALGVNPETAGGAQANVLAIRIDYQDTNKKSEQFQVDISEQFKEDVNVNLDVTLNVDVKNNTVTVQSITIKPWKHENGEDMYPTEPNKTKQPPTGDSEIERRTSANINE